jgi:ABC-type nitrate/sulfonate/bicarbonate transport system substrate-binding protein
MIIKTFVIIAFLLIILSLGSALYHLVKRDGDAAHSEKTVKALTFRIGLSVLLFILIFIAYATGFIQPEGIGARIHQPQSSSTPTSP